MSHNKYITTDRPIGPSTKIVYQYGPASTTKKNVVFKDPVEQEEPESLLREPSASRLPSILRVRNSVVYEPSVSTQRSVFQRADESRHGPCRGHRAFSCLKAFKFFR